MGPSQGTGELSVFFQILTSRKLMESEAHFSHGALTTSLQFCGHDGLFRHSCCLSMTPPTILVHLWTSEFSVSISISVVTGN